MYKLSILFLVCLLVRLSSSAQNDVRTNLSTFETVPLNSFSFNNGSDLKGGFVNGHFFYRNNYDTTWKSWSGFAVSNTTDTFTQDFTNEYSSVTGKGINGTSNYAVCFGSGTVIPEKKQSLTGFYVTNSTYAYNTILKGGAFSKKFGGVSGNDKDWFRIKITNYDKGIQGDEILFYLADYQNDDNSKDYIVKNWEWIDLSKFASTDSLKITFEGSDVGQFGLNTPAYVIIDDFNAVPPTSINMMPGLSFSASDFFTKGNVWNGEHDTSGGFVYGKCYFENTYNTQWKAWSGWAVSKNNDTSKVGLDAQYSAITAKGTAFRLSSGPDSSYAVSYGRSVIRLPYKKGGWPITYLRFAITNNTYTYKAMKNGDAFSKKFGGILGTDPDYLKLYIVGYDDKNMPVDTIGNDEMMDEMALADFRMNRMFLNQNWFYHISGGFKKNIVRMEFQLESTDMGAFGMNTPEYFCLDNLFEYPVESVNHQSLLNLKVYPNPAKNYILADVQNTERYEVIDLNGKQVLENNKPESNQIDISQLNSGVYCLKLEAAGHSYFARFIKQ
jgi:hypothetical protein